MGPELKKFESFENKPPILYRVGTSDESIIQTVFVERKEYVFPPAFDPKIIFDIGANIGVVSVILANLYPEAKIYAFEPERENYEILEKNVSSYPNVKTFEVGLGDRMCSRVLFKSDDSKNLGGFSTHIKGKGQVADDSITILKTSTLIERFGTPDLIKIDCEGAEYEILNDVPEIEKVKWIAGELHGINDFHLLAMLNEKGFNLQLSGKHKDSKIWHFFAENKGGLECNMQKSNS